MVASSTPDGRIVDARWDLVVGGGLAYACYVWTPTLKARFRAWRAPHRTPAVGSD